MNASIAAMTNDDIGPVIQLWSQTDGVGLNESDTPENLQAYLARNAGLSLVARDGDTLIAAVLCGHDGRRGFLNHLAVVPAYRGRGYGRLLVESCLRSLQATGVLKCNIYVYADNEEGKRFWRKMGWSIRGDLQVMQKLT